MVMAQAWRRRHPYAFAGKSVLITGGSRGLGLVIARQLASEGARLTLIARDEAELQRAASDLRGTYPDLNVLTLAADIRKRYDVDRAIAQAASHHGAIDVLINNAGTIQVGPI